MIWLFERGDDVVRLETRFENATGEYVVVIAWAAREAETERFSDYDTFHARILALETQLDAEHWAQAGSPTILPRGWRGPIPH